MIRNNRLLPIGGHRFVAFIGPTCSIIVLIFASTILYFLINSLHVAIILNKSFPTDFHAMFLTFIEFAMINASLILWV
jgi:hypothetical protein